MSLCEGVAGPARCSLAHSWVRFVRLHMCGTSRQSCLPALVRSLLRQIPRPGRPRTAVGTNSTSPTQALTPVSTMHLSLCEDRPECDQRREPSNPRHTTGCGLRPPRVRAIILVADGAAPRRRSSNSADWNWPCCGSRKGGEQRVGSPHSAIPTVGNPMQADEGGKS